MISHTQLRDEKMTIQERNFTSDSTFVLTPGVDVSLKDLIRYSRPGARWSLRKPPGNGFRHRETPWKIWLHKAR
jgi:hypothetical protein